MTAVAPVRAPAPASPIPAAAPHRGSVLRRPWAMAAVLLALYVVLSFVTDSRAVFVSDVGGKVATLRVMDARGDLDPDIGYWASRFDPTGRFHPLDNTVHVDEGWVNVTTLPMLYAARPLHALGGTRAALLVPMAAAVAVALGARALARRLEDGADAGDRAFWLVGLATPVLLYALDLWEHAPGLACMVWAVVLAVDVTGGRRGAGAALGAGVLFGAAATMRTEALVYAFVAGLVFGVATWTRRARPPLAVGGAFAAGMAAILAANQLLERVAFGAGLRATRTTDTAGMVGSGLESRARDALITAVGLNRLAYPTDWLVGAGVAVAVGIAAWAFVGSDRARRRIGWIALAVAAYAYLGWLLQGLGFLPGMLTASPLAVVGLVVAWRRRTARLLALVAVIALPIVWLTQYSGGTAPVWGARYLLCSSTLLAVVGITALGRMPRRAAAAFVVLAVFVTASGFAWMVVRTHTFADAFAQITAGDDPLVVAQAPQLLREAGGFFHPGDRWLTVRDDADVDGAVRIVARAGAERFTLVTVERSAAPRRLDGYRRTQVRVLPLTRSVDAVASTYERRSA